MPRPFSSTFLRFSLLRNIRKQLLVALSIIVAVAWPQISAQTMKAGTDDPSGTSQSASTGEGTQAAQPAATSAAPGLVHIVPFGRNGNKGLTKTAIPIPAGSTLKYWGGPVISQVHVVAVFWGPNVNAAIAGAGAIDQFFTDITNSRYYDMLTEYSTTGVTGVGTPVASSNQPINRGVFDGKVTITPVLCATASAASPCSLTDAQVQQELTRQVTAATLPQPVFDAQGNANTFYMIYFPPGVSITVGTDRSCVTFCAYHSNTDTPFSPRFIPYGVLPDFAPPSACSTGCGTGSLFDNVTAVTSHEMAEAVTDALVGSAATSGPPLAWYDMDLIPGTNVQLAEIGDICNGSDGTVTAGGHTYTVQQEFSNLQGQCVLAPPNFDMTLPPAVPPASSFNLTLSVDGFFGSVPITFQYRGTVHFTSSDPAAVLPPDYTFVATDNGSHTFPITLNTLGDQTITITDVRAAGFTGTATTNVNTNPDLAVTKTHVGNFTQGQPGSYSIVVSNTGQGPTAGTVTLVDTLPTGMTAASIGGTGWTCDLPTLTCTRSDVLARNASYPAIALAVNVAIDAPVLLTNSARVSGGGEINTANDTANDPTTINVAPHPDMFVSKTHNGPILGNFFQGETGATYSLLVTNVGNLASSGTVTVTDTLPAGLTATAISGTGWTCDLPSLTCTRSDSLAASANYPAITVTVNVSLTAPSSVVNVATVAGGGEINTANNVSQDPTTILPPPAPDMTVLVSHTNPVLQGLSTTYDIITVNSGTGATTAPVTVVDTLPAGFTATSMSGTGWTCTLATLSCTRSDTIPFNSGYPDIFLTADVAPNATSGNNTVTVSGGGETNTTNDTATDATKVLPQFVDLVPSFGHPGGFTQGQVGATYFVNVVNNGTIASSGLVTIVNTLPASMTATAISGFGWNCALVNLTCTRSDALPPPAVYPEITVTVNVAGNAPDTIILGANLSGGGDSVATNNNVTDTNLVTRAVNLVPSGPTAATVAAGQPASFDFLAVVQSTAGTATFTCSGLPTGAKCSFNPPTASLVGIPVTLTVTTTSRAGAVIVQQQGPQLWIALWVVATILLCMFTLDVRKRKALRWSLAFGVMGLLLMIGCGGGGGGGGNNFVTPTPTPTPTPNVNGTPAGTYAITVSATGATAGSASQVFTLTVN